MPRASVTTVMAVNIGDCRRRRRICWSRMISNTPGTPDRTHYSRWDVAQFPGSFRPANWIWLSDSNRRKFANPVFFPHLGVPVLPAYPCVGEREDAFI